MDAIVTGLLQLGGVGALAAAILLLHRESLRSFREELSKDRAMHDAVVTRMIESDVQQRELTRLAFTEAVSEQQARHGENVTRLEQILEHVRATRHQTQK